MLIVTLLYIILLIFLSIRKYGILLNPFFFEAHFSLLFLVIPQLIMVNVFPDSVDSTKSDLIIIAYVTAVYLGTCTRLKSFRIPEIRNGKSVAFVDFVVAALFIIPTLSILINCGLSFGGIRCYYETVVFSKFASLYDLGKTFLFLSIILFLVYKKGFNIWILILMTFLIFSGNKFAIFNLLLFFAIFFEEYKGVKIRKMVIWSLPLFLLLIGYHFLQSQSYFENPFLAAIRYFDIYEKQTFLVNELAKPRHDFYWGEIYFSSFYKYIPRILWADKPVEFGFAILNYEFLPDEASQNYMPSFGLGTLYADWGFASVIVLGFLAGFFRQYTYQIFLKSGKNNAALLLYYFGVTPLTFLYLGTQYLVSLFLKPNNKN